MEYISQSLINFSKGNLKCILKYTKFPGKKGNGCMSETNLALLLIKKKGEEKFHIPNF